MVWLNPQFFSKGRATYVFKHFLGVSGKIALEQRWNSPNPNIVSTLNN